MADNEIGALQNQGIVKEGNSELRRTVQQLPAFYRTDANQRFLSSTLDPLIQKGALERLDGFIGRQDAYTRKNTDRYILATDKDRLAYQLEPTVTYTDKDTTSVNPEDQVKFTGTYDDYINQLKYFGAKTNNHDRLNKETVYAWNPAIDYDKLINYREYYWLPDGPNPIEIDSVGTNATVELKAESWPDDGSSARAWNFPHKENERNPIVTLYRGNTYKFSVDAKGDPFWIMTEPYKDKVSADGSTSTIYTTGVTNNGTDSGTVTFTVPTTAPDTLYYQSATTESMYGILQVKSVTDTTQIIPDDLIGVKNYSLRTLDLSNGMKIKFSNTKVSSEYQNKEYYVEGVGDAITLTDTSNLLTPESYATESTIPYDSVVYDSRPYSKAFYRPEAKDYITIKRDSLDQNAWSRYNRWFHKSVIEKTAEASGYTASLDETDRAKRPIIEFDSGLRLYNHGTVAKNSVTLFDNVTKDAFSNVVGTSGYIVDGVSLANGMRVIFSADTDPIVKNKIYEVQFVTAGDSTAVINLTETADTTPGNLESIYVEFGTDQQGKTYFYDSASTSWKTSQTKTEVNQQPLFSMFDNNHISFDDPTTYPNSSFEGAKVFAFATSDSATKDTVLGIKVKYNTINNVGDIVFDSDHTSGTFTYKSDAETITKNLAEGHLHYTTSATTHNNKGAWVKRTIDSKQRVIRTFVVGATEKKLFPIDFYENSSALTDLELSVRVNAVNKDLTTDYTLVSGTVNKYVKFNEDLEVGDQIRIAGYSSAEKVDDKGIYEIPENLETNAENLQLGTFTYGQILGHVQDILDKNSDVTGVIPGTSNLRDKPDARLKGGRIHQHDGSLLPAVFGLIDQQTNVIRSIEYTSQEYEKWYNSFLTYAVGTAYEGVPADRVDEIISAISQGKNSSFPFYYEDMVGYGENVSVRNYTVQDSSITEYAIDSIFSTTTLSNRALYVYVNDVQLILNSDYTVSTTDDSINITSTLAAGDKIKIKDYEDTTGSYIPPTPTKLGMYPKFTPQTFTDNTYLTSTTVIRKHDGSIIKSYGDERDDLILELEKRIYNNCKTAYDATLLNVDDVTPSAFNSTEYSLNDVTEIMGPDFYTWAGRNGVQYINNTVFKEATPFTYNYSRSTDRLNKTTLPGYWRGIYKYFYDTDSPHTRPWEMFGFSEKPSTWEDTYGPAPYTSANDILWTAIETKTGRYGKPDIKKYLPVDASGNLLDPIATGLIDNFNFAGIDDHFKFGDQSPAETAWRRSSSYPYSAVKMLALSKPAKFFTIFFDNSRLSLNVANNLIDKDTGVRQTLAKAKYHLETSTNNATGVTTRFQTAGYQPFVVNYLIFQNLDPITFFYNKMKNLTIQLAYKLGGFSDKDNLKILTDSISPGSSANSKFIPDENFKVLFRTSNPINTYNYSGVLIEKNSEISKDGSTLIGGYKVLGYSITKPFFNFYYPRKSVSGSRVEVAGQAVEKFENYQDNFQTIPYGYVFDTIQEVADFLFGYGKYLEEQGFSFNKYTSELKTNLDFTNAVREFLFWTTQNWSAGSAITVSPGAAGLELKTENSVVGRLRNIAGDYSMLDSGGNKIPVSQLSTKRVGTTFSVDIKSDNVGLFNIDLNAVVKEHLLLFDNKTVFSDIIYDPYTGFRQPRLKVVGWKSGNWNGDYYSPGFVFDSAEVSYWAINGDYKIGDTVEYQGKFYVAKVNHNSGNKFVTEKWMYKREKPKPQLIPNFDYKIQQFNDFYNLETNNFDESQQQLAQRLIGYQSRDYLENLFVNDISQYKFYQGYIREKGTKSAIDRLLKAQYEESDIALDLYPEWMIKSGTFGNTDARENIQITLNENEIVAEPQSIELFDNPVFSKNYNRSLGIAKQNFHYSPIDYTASSTFSQYDYSQEGFDRDSVQVYKTAGYPQLSQVQRTAFRENNLLEINVNELSTNDLIWIANKPNSDWDVYRVTNSGVTVELLQPINDATEMIITFSGSHNLTGRTRTKTSDYFAIRNAQLPDLNNVFRVKQVIDHRTLLIDYTGAIDILPTLGDNSTASSYGSLYKFVSVRLNSIDNVNDLLDHETYIDKDTANDTPGDKVFADADSSGLWRVYEKQDPYTTVKKLSPDNSTTNQDFGFQIVARNDGRTAVVSAPTKSQGEVHFLFRSSSTAGTVFSNQATVTMTENDDNTSQLGYSLSMSTDENFVVAGAPFTNTIGSDGSTRFNDSGLIKIYLWNPSTFTYGILNTITPPSDLASQNFGWSHKISEPGADSVRTTATKYLFVGAPGFADGAQSNEGRVYMYEWSIGSDGSTYDSWVQNLTISSNDPASEKRFGHAIAANDNGDILAVSSKAPGSAGMVEIFRRTSQSNDDSVEHSFTYIQTLVGTASDGSTLNTNFGDTLAMSKDGTTLIIGAPGFDNGNQADAGVVYHYKWDADGDSTLSYSLQQTINAPTTNTNLKFGSSLDINDSGNRIVIGAENFGNSRDMRFDSGETTFDLQDTQFVDTNVGSGGAFTATKYNTKYVIDDTLVTTAVSEDDNFGKGVCIIDNTVFVGAPDDDGNIDTSDGSSIISNDGTTTVFDCTTAGEFAWKNIASETNFMDTNKLGTVFDFDSRNNSIRNYYELYDPVKGRIPGAADREINIKTTWDPAHYNFGEKINTKLAWAETHIGEVWWDLSQIKWLWYEQSTQEYRANNWGSVFPGSEVHIYEWIESSVLPSQYIDGIPLHPDDTNYTVKQRYSSASDSFVDVYYYWVRNASFIPDNTVVVRRLATESIANLISNAKQQLKYYAVTDTNKLLLGGSPNLSDDSIKLNVDFRTNNFEGDSHSVWKLVREGDKNYRPGTQIETRWWDSLIGKNSEGDLVPDISLAINERYGNSTRPRQSWYADRYAALKEIIDYANDILKKNQLTGTINLENLNASDPEPTEASLEWDATVDTYAELTYLDTRDLSGTVKYLVKADEQSNGFWAIYTWDGTEFTRTKLQSFNTSKYWSYVDWYGTDPDVHEMIHDENTPIDKLVTYEYELDQLDLEIGKHVKVTQADTGGWKIYMKTTSGFTNVGTENGTIRLSTKLYDYSQDATGYAGGDNFDDNFFDQEPSTETRNILTALRDDLLINELAIEYNTLFFTGLRKVLSEQTYVDWMFKTSFINVKNSIRKLDQRKTYTKGTDEWVESYINEVKPFATKLREYKLGYTGTDTEDGIFTDFDNPPFYDANQSKIRPLNVSEDTAKLTEYPWQMWNDYHKKYVKSLTILTGGSGYETAPTVIILGGTVASTGPFQILGTSSSGTTSGSYGYYYPLFTSATQANIWDSQNGGSGASHSHTFDGITGTFYMPTGSMNHAMSNKSGDYKMYETPDTSQATATATVSDGVVTKITLTSGGKNYTTTPAVILQGGKLDGSAPDNPAKLYANLENDLVRDFDTTIKFDRVSSASSVVDWEPTTSYAYGQYIRYNNTLYRVTDAFTSTPDFDDNLKDLYKLYGDETGLTAADRTKGFYAPTAGMPGNELSQLMSGVDYGGTMVTGLLFSQEQGWDKAGWYDYPFDNYGASKVKTFYADGSSEKFIFDTAPPAGTIYHVYITENDSSRRKTDDIFRGDGSTTVFSLAVMPNEGAMVEFIEFDDDGVLTPTDDRTLDSIVKGGLFKSALGTNPSDILLEGDGFVTPDTSYAPEENVPGQLFDTCDIKVYTSPESGVPFISEKNHRGDGSTTTFAIGDFPGTLGSVTVSVNGDIKKLTTDYTINVGDKTITFGTAPIMNSVVATRTFAISGENYRVLDQFTGDGSTAQFTTSTRGEFNLDSTSSEIYVTVDGVPTTAFTSTITANTVTITFGDDSSIPAANSFIQIAGFNKSTTSTRSFASVRTEAFTFDGTTARLTLTYPPGSIGPFSGLTLIEANGKMLRGPDNTYYTGDGSTYTYGVATGLSDDSTVDPAKTITSATQVEVFVNGVEKNLNTHYTVDIGNQNVNFVTDSVPSSTDVICISTIVDNQYSNDGNDIVLDLAQLTADGQGLSANDVLNVTTFNNALGMKQRREVLEGRPSGIFQLRFDTLNDQYTFVWLNGEQLVPNFDYTLSGNTITVVGRTITSSDRLDVMYFALETAVSATGFRIFKDMLNRTFYKRISKAGTTELVDQVDPEDQQIKVKDGTTLPDPMIMYAGDGSTVRTIIPGVIFIDKERIEYFTKTGALLGQLKRGTLGTGIKDHSPGAEVVDASGTQTIPYVDTIYTDTHTGDGSSVTFTTTQTVTNASQLDIFIGGQRLLLTSEDGSTVNYSVDGSTSAVTLTTAPANKTEIKILHKKGQVWYTAKDGNPSDGKGLQASTSAPARFIAEEDTNAPE